jgi:hypothetical protein
MAGIYENVYIGAFILAMGHRMRREMPDAFPLASVNLYQQTPADALFGDLLVDLSGLCVLIEFKRDWRNTPSEVEKYLDGDFGEQVASHNLTEIANSCHYLGFSVAREGRHVDLEFCTYLSLWDPARGDDAPSSTAQLDSFLGDLLSGNVGVAADQLQEYLALLSGRDAGGASCLLVNCSREDGVRLFVVDEIRLLQKTRAELNELLQAQERERNRRRQEPPEDLRIRIRQ